MLHCYFRGSLRGSSSAPGCATETLGAQFFRLSLALAVPLFGMKGEAGECNRGPGSVAEWIVAGAIGLAQLLDRRAFGRVPALPERCSTHRDQSMRCPLQARDAHYFIYL